MNAINCRRVKFIGNKSTQKRTKRTHTTITTTTKIIIIFFIKRFTTLINYYILPPPIYSTISTISIFFLRTARSSLMHLCRLLFHFSTQPQSEIWMEYWL